MVIHSRRIFSYSAWIILSHMNTLATYIHQFQGNRIGKQGPTISHLFFTNDSMFFFKLSTEACQAVSTVINRFFDISGQLLNLQKSFVKFCSSIPQVQQQEYKSMLLMDSHSSLCTYLGTPIDIQVSKV